MSTANTTDRRSLVAASAVLALALIVCTIIGAGALVKVRGMGRTISVTGAAYQPIRSDYAIWEGVVTVQAPTLEPAYAKLKTDLQKLTAFLKENGFEPSQYDLGTVSLYRQYNDKSEPIGFNVSQTVMIELGDVDRIRKLAEDASSLIEKGVQMESRPPQYLFTGLDTLKIGMIEQATENAKLRAEQLAKIAGGKIGPPTSASVGVFQIRPQHSQEVSGYGMSDVSSIEKEIVSTVHVDFLID